MFCSHFSLITLFLLVLTRVRAQIRPLSTYCRQVAAPCSCESEANMVAVRCPNEYAMLLELSDTTTSIYLSYYAPFEVSHLPCFDIAAVDKFEFDAYVFWSSTFLSDLQTALGIQTVAVIEFRDRRDDTYIISKANEKKDEPQPPSLAQLIVPATPPEPVSLINDLSAVWHFNSVQELHTFKFESNINELDSSIFHAFNSLSSLELKLCVSRLPNQLLASVKHSLQTLTIHNPHLVTFDALLLRDLQQLRNVTVMLRERGGKLQHRLFAHMEQLEEVHLIRACGASLEPQMFQNSSNLKLIQIIDNDMLSALPNELFSDQYNLTVLDLHNNGLTELSNVLFAALGNLQSLDLSYNKLTSLSSEIFAPLVSLQMLNVNYNALIALEPATFSEMRSLNFIDMRGTQFYSTQLTMHYEALVCTNDDFCQYKAYEWECASSCICWVHRQTRELIVDCRDSELETLPDLPQTMLVRTVLKAANNSLKALPAVSTAGYANVTELHLADNQLSSLDDPSLLPGNLSFLDVRRNQISTFGEAFLSYLEQENCTLSLALAGNPLHCDCDALPLLNFVRGQPQRVRDVSELQCASGATSHNKSFQQLDISDICPSYILLIGCIAGGLVIIACLLSVVYLVYQQQLKIWMYNHNLCLWWVSEEELDKDKLYDAFIAYSHKDEDIISKLLPKLESGPHAFRICLHGRDWLVGDCIPEQIVRTVDDSKRVIIILSQHFIDSVWARMEFRIAYQATLQDKRKRIIIILYKELEHYEGIDSELRAYLKLNTYLKWGDPLFWSKLRYAMPHNRRVLKGQKKRPLPLV